VDPRFVSELFNEGWHKDRRNEAVNIALEILKRTDLDPEVIKAAAAMQLTTDSPTSFRTHKPKRKKKETSLKAGFFGNISPLFIAIGAVIVFLLFGQKKEPTV
jgi:hypothetical protein